MIDDPDLLLYLDSIRDEVIIPTDEDVKSFYAFDPSHAKDVAKFIKAAAKKMSLDDPYAIERFGMLMYLVGRTTMCGRVLLYGILTKNREVTAKILKLAINDPDEKQTRQKLHQRLRRYVRKLFGEGDPRRQARNRGGWRVHDGSYIGYADEDLARINSLFSALHGFAEED